MHFIKPVDDKVICTKIGPDKNLHSIHTARKHEPTLYYEHNKAEGSIEIARIGQFMVISNDKLYKVGMSINWLVKYG